MRKILRRQLRLISKQNLAIIFWAMLVFMSPQTLDAQTFAHPGIPFT